MIQFIAGILIGACGMAIIGIWYVISFISDNELGGYED